LRPAVIKKNPSTGFYSCPIGVYVTLDEKKEGWKEIHTGSYQNAFDPHYIKWLDSAMLLPPTVKFAMKTNGADSLSGYWSNASQPGNSYEWLICAVGKTRSPQHRSMQDFCQACRKAG